MELMDEYPGVRSFKNYYKISIPERIRLLEKFWKIPDLRKLVAILFKLIFNQCIKEEDYESAEMGLKTFEDIHTEVAYVIPEIILLKEKSETAKRILEKFKENYSDNPYVESILFCFINEHISKIRIIKLKELSLFVNEGFTISEELLNKVKELSVRAPMYEKVEYICPILRKMNDPESKELLKEIGKLTEYMNSHQFVFSKSWNFKNQDWEDHYINLRYPYIHPGADIFKYSSMEEVVDSFLEVLNHDRCILLKVMVIDILLEEIVKSDKLVDELSSRGIFASLLRLTSLNGYSLLVEKSIILLENISLKRENWLRDNLIMYFENNKGSPHILDPIINILAKNISYIKIEILNSLKYALENNLLDCDKGTALLFMNVLIHTANNQPWIVFKKSLAIIFSCPHVLENKELLRELVDKLIGYAKTSDRGNYVLIYLKGLLSARGVEIKELGKEIADVFEDLEKNMYFI